MDHLQDEISGLGTTPFPVLVEEVDQPLAPQAEDLVGVRAVLDQGLNAHPLQGLGTNQGDGRGKMRMGLRKPGSGDESARGAVVDEGQGAVAVAADMFRDRGVLAMLGFKAGAKYSVEETRKMMFDAWNATGSKFK